jgi:7-alpha-hydroxysteroid dehydrogenase
VNGPLRLLDRFFVTDRVAIVSGSGRGIGAACARTLAEAGASVNISSAMAKNPDRGMLPGGTAKAALSYMTKLMSRDLAPRIRVNAVASGSTWTPALERYYTAAELGANIARTPMRRLGTPEDIALAVLFFASPASGYVTGEVLEVDGGIDGPNSPSVLPDLLSM